MIFLENTLKFYAKKMMILDVTIGLFMSLLGIIFEGIAIVSVPLINLIVAVIEAIIGLFASGYRLGRINRKKGSKSVAYAAGGIVILLIILGLIAWIA